MTETVFSWGFGGQSVIRLRTDCRQTPLAHLTGTDTQDGFPEAEWVLPQHASAGAYTVKDAVTDYLAEIQAEKKPVAVQGTEYLFDARIPSSIQVEKLTADRLNRWHSKLATQPKGVRCKRTATDHPQTRGAPARRPPTESSQC